MAALSSRTDARNIYWRLSWHGLNFTVALERDGSSAKIIAAKSDTSRNALFNSTLRHLVETFEVPEGSEHQRFKMLLNSSLWRSDNDCVFASKLPLLRIPKLPGIRISVSAL